MTKFLTCFKIAKKNKGVLYWTVSSYSYSICRDRFGEVIFDFRNGQKFGKELRESDIKLFYKR